MRLTRIALPTLFVSCEANLDASAETTVLRRRSNARGEIRGDGAAPQAIRPDVQPRAVVARLVGTRHEVKRTVELRHLVEKDVQIERLGLRHAVLGMVGGEVVVPLPDLAREGGLHVDLYLLT